MGKIEGIHTKWGFVFAGGYNTIPGAADFVLNLTAEIDTQHSMRVPIRDFSVPHGASGDQAMRKALMAVIARVSQGQIVYVHCMGGTGRTGMFLALLSKIEDEHIDDVRRVRAEYRTRAVETAQQEKYVETLPVADIRRWASCL